VMEYIFNYFTVFNAISLNKFGDNDFAQKVNSDLRSTLS